MSGDCFISNSGKKEVAEKYIFDTNIFDDMVNEKLKVSDIVKYKNYKKVEIYVTHIQLMKLINAVMKIKEQD